MKLAYDQFGGCQSLLGASQNSPKMKMNESGKTVLDLWGKANTSLIQE